MIRWAVFISGHGSNLASLLEIRQKYPIALVVSSNAKAYGLKRASEAKVPTYTLRADQSWLDLLDKLKAEGITHIFLAGFLKIIPKEFLQKWQGPIVNLHPSLLPSYPGLKSIERAYNDNAAIGVTIHHVVSEVDSGPVILQQKIYAAGEAQKYSLAEVTEQVHKVEHELVKRAVEVLCKTS